MDDEIQLISDGDGLAVIGNPTAVERFLTSEGPRAETARICSQNRSRSRTGRFRDRRRLRPLGEAE
jgi:hypothetical protein